MHIINSILREHPSHHYHHYRYCWLARLFLLLVVWQLMFQHKCFLIWPTKLHNGRKWLAFGLLCLEWVSIEMWFHQQQRLQLIEVLFGYFRNMCWLNRFRIEGAFVMFRSMITNWLILTSKCLMKHFTVHLWLCCWLLSIRVTIQCC